MTKDGLACTTFLHGALFPGLGDPLVFEKPARYFPRPGRGFIRPHICPIALLVVQLWYDTLALENELSEEAAAAVW